MSSLVTQTEVAPFNIFKMAHFVFSHNLARVPNYNEVR